LSRSGEFRAQPVAGGVFRRAIPALGLFVWEFAGSGMWPILATTGLDFAVIDNEHASFSARETALLLGGARSTSLPALVRVPEVTRSDIGKALDGGADGIVAPRVSSRAEAEALVRYAKYAPAGDRGVAFGCAHDGYGAGAPTLQQVAKVANAETVCVAMIETTTGVENVDEICTTPGVDALWVGFADLSQSLGRAGEYDSAEFRAAEQRILATAAMRDVPVGVLVPTAAGAIAEIGRGYSAIALGTEVTVLQRGITTMVETIRSSCDG
jgi:2-dehydro-3-deoxyglucarate aldolase/4-hydroxy-2-oxoheptanedioate aldolase